MNFEPFEIKNSPIKASNGEVLCYWNHSGYRAIPNRHERLDRIIGELIVAQNKNRKWLWRE